MTWIRAQKFEHAAHEATLVDYLAEVDHAIARIERLESAIDDAVRAAPDVLREVIAALQALRGLKKIVATTLAVEIGNFSRFSSAKQLMGYSGTTPSEYSSGKSRYQGGITKSGNAHIRRVLFESAWAYRHRPSNSREIAQRQRGLPENVIATAWKAQHRLHRRYVTLQSRGKPTQKVVTAVGRELLGFVWAIATSVEQSMQTKPAAKAA